MNKIVCETYDDACKAAADLFEMQLFQKKDSVFGLATGGTPIGLYEELSKRVDEGKIDFSHAKAFNLDEYYPMKRSHPQSYKAYMDEHLFSKVKFASTDIPNGEALDANAECARYEAAIKSAGGIDFQLLGIGFNGHIGFNEPDVEYYLDTNLTKLADKTLEANSRFFENPDDQPTSAFTMGFSSIFAAKHAVMFVTGAGKAEIISKLSEGKIYTDIPASFLLLHPNFTLVLDKEANGE